MLDIPSVTGIIAAIGVIVGVIFTVMELRNLVKQRQTDLITNLYSIFASEGFQKEYYISMKEETSDYNTYRKKYAVEVPPTGLFFNELGILLNEKLIDRGLISKLFGVGIMRYWEKAKLIVKSGRRELNNPRWGWGIEYLCNEMKKREQQLATIQ